MSSYILAILMHLSFVLSGTGVIKLYDLITLKRREPTDVLVGILFTYTLGLALFTTIGSCSAFLHCGWVGLELSFSCTLILAIFGATTLPTYLRHIPQSIGSKDLRRSLVLCIVPLFFLFPYVVSTLLPIFDWDSVAYHLPIAKSMINGYFPNSDPLLYKYSNVAGPHLVYSLFLGIGRMDAIQPYCFCLLGFISLACYKISSELTNRKFALISILFLFSFNALLETATDPRVETSMCLFSILVVFFAIDAQKTRSSTSIILVGVSVGLLLTAKFTGIFIIPPLVIALLIRMLKDKITFSEILKKFGILLASCLMVCGIWYAHNIYTFGDPFYPILKGSYTVSESEPSKKMRIDPAFEKMVRDSENDVGFQEYLSKIQIEVERPDNFNGLNLIDVIQNPTRYIRKDNENLNAFIIAFLFLPLFTRNFYAIFVYAVGLFLLILPLSQTFIIRYALPSIPLIAIVMTLICFRLPSKFLKGTLILCAFYFLISNYQGQFKKIDEITNGEGYFPEENRISWIKKKAGYNYAIGIPRTIDEVNKYLSSKEENQSVKKIMMLGFDTNFDLNYDTYPDDSEYLENWMGFLIRNNNSYDQIIKDLKSRGISHFLINQASVESSIKENRRPKKTILYAYYKFSHFCSLHCSKKLIRGPATLYEFNTFSKKS